VLFRLFIADIPDVSTLVRADSRLLPGRIYVVCLQKQSVLNSRGQPTICLLLGFIFNGLEATHLNQWENKIGF
jgi:hypothetical protein